MGACSRLPNFIISPGPLVEMPLALPNNTFERTSLPQAKLQKPVNHVTGLPCNSLWLQTMIVAQTTESAPQSTTMKDEKSSRFEILAYWPSDELLSMKPQHARARARYTVLRVRITDPLVRGWHDLFPYILPHLNASYCSNYDYDFEYVSIPEGHSRIKARAQQLIDGLKYSRDAGTVCTMFGYMYRPPCASVHTPTPRHIHVGHIYVPLHRSLLIATQDHKHEPRTIRYSTKVKPSSRVYGSTCRRFWCVHETVCRAITK
ncbi:hypothetical protein CONLIGDRAFT_641999 [Coniochaeta ligniaria NRRL 30616]|uniref:Uncharacterized protein n=1 Tax=Coniochaeta ligniaria NRRL 30616 TaxID=1408157 RepID=A0A1J7JFZ9_9PEZI|nr:hypothetical protein CONLIGDRAFT_641999 [Coniochaeta ligniaria NRRL 30616]